MARYKGGAKYISNIPQTKSDMKALEALALKEIGKYLTKEVKNGPEMRTGVKARTYKNKAGKDVLMRPGRLKRSVGYWYRRREHELQIGLKAFYATYYEFGSLNITKSPLLEPVVVRNINTIRLIAGKYIPRIAYENYRMGIVEEEVGD